MRLRRRLLCVIVFLAAAACVKASLPDSLKAELAGLPDSAKVKNLIGKSFAAMYSDLFTAQQYLALAREIADQPGNDHLIPKVINQSGTLKWVAGQYREALADYQSAEQLFQKTGDARGAAKAQNNIGLVYRDMSYHDLALEALLKSASYFESHPEPYALATLYTNIGNVCNSNDDRTQAAAYYLKALRYFEELSDTNGLSMVHNNLGLIYNEAGNGQAALSHYEVALQGYKSRNNRIGEASVLTNLAVIHLNNGQLEVAESLTVRSLTIATEEGSISQQAISELKLSELYLKWGRAQDAIAHGLASLAAGEASHALLPEASAHEVLAIAYAQAGQYEPAYGHLKSQKALNDSIFNQGKARAIEEMRLRYDMQLKDQALATYAGKQRLDKLTKIGLGIVIGLLLLLGLVVYARQRGIIKREQALQQKDKEMHAAQKALADAELKAADADLKAADANLKAVESERLRLQGELGFKSREISSLALNIVRQNDLLEMLDRELKTLRKGADEQKIKELSLLVSQTLSLDNERMEFQLYVQQAQQNFFLNLEAAFPDLSAKEKRLCAMIKLGLSSKEIAAVFNIESSSVEVARHRLRKKLGLDPAAGLKEFLEGF